MSQNPSQYNTRAMQTFGSDYIELNDMKVVESTHDFLVVLCIFLRSVCIWECAWCREGVAWGAEMAHGCCSSIFLRRVGNLKQINAISHFRQSLFYEIYSYLHVLKNNPDITLFLFGQLRGEIFDSLGDPETGQSVFLLKLYDGHLQVQL